MEILDYFPLIFQAQIALLILVGLLFFVCVPSFVLLLFKRNLKILKTLLLIRQLLKDKYPEKLGAFQNILSLDFDTVASSAVKTFLFYLKHGSFFPGAFVGMGSFLTNFLSVEDIYALNDQEIQTHMDSLLAMGKTQRRFFVGFFIFIAGMVVV